MQGINMSRMKVGLWTPWLLVSVMLVGVISCSPDVLLNNVASLGGSSVGSRGIVQVVFDNQTQYRAIFTFGTYDSQDKNSVPIYGQFVVDSSQAANEFNRGLQPSTTTSITSFTPRCGRVISFGGQDMIDRIQRNKIQPFNGATPLDAAFRAGIYFTTAPLDDPDANAEQSFVLHLAPVISTLGVDYEADSRLLFQFVPDPNKPGNVLIKLTSIRASNP